MQLLFTAALLLVSPTDPEAASVAPPTTVTERSVGSVDDMLTVTAEQAKAVERGLQWLADHQNSDGSWSSKVGFKLHEDYSYQREESHVGVTSLACMSFLAGGHLPGRGKYGKVIEKGLDFVLSCVHDDGYISQFGTRMYSHAFATLFLAEIYGMTHRDDVRLKLQKSIDFIVKSQNKDGGWRYEPYAVESDMSIVVCQVLALRAARNIGIRVPKATVDRAAKYVVDSAVSEGNARRSRSGHWRNEVGTFLYQVESRSRSSFPLTAAGVTALHGVGIYSDEAIRNGLDYLQRRMSYFNSEYGRRGHYFFWYGHYYGVQAMYTAGTPYWEPYFIELRDTLVEMQNSDGSFPNSVGPGQAFGTAMGVLILEIPYRFLPIFQR